MNKIKWKRASFFRLITEIDNKEVVIFKDSGTMGLHAYYGVMVDGEVVSHGHNQRAAKSYVIDNILNKGQK